MSAFHLEKYYMDCITPTGDLFLSYAARLNWIHLSVTGANTLHKPAGKTALQESSLRHIALPVYTNGELRWDNTFPLVHGVWEHAAHGFSLDLSHNRRGILHWDCLQPAARARVTADNGTTLEGYGYTEKITLTIKPWELGITALQWGHYAAEGDYLVWLTWAGSSPLAFACYNGVTYEACTIEPGGVSFPGGTLRFTDPEAVRTGKVISTVFRHIPLLHDVFVETLETLSEEKHLSPAVLTAGGKTREGWAVYEQLHW